ncbi:MAG TPA: hypothetical protein VJV04_07595 [Nitrospiraceae bacterium]|nr:hypothetical protein [Nitrospiraceae bacterium]
MATKIPPPNKPVQFENQAVREVELLRVVVSREQKKVAAQWALHPQLKQDLLPAEWEEVSKLMGEVTNLVGKRFAQVLSEAEPDQPGTA